MIRKAKPGFKLGGKPRPEKVRDNVEFELEKGKITIIDKMILFQQPKPSKGSQKQQVWFPGIAAAERIQKELQDRTERKKEQKEMKKQKVRFVQIIDLDESFKTKILEELKEVENIDQWKLE